MLSPPQPTGIPVLDEKTKSIPQRRFNTNFNNLIFVEISNRYREDAFAVIKAHPRVYLRSVAVAAGLYFLPTSDYRSFTANRNRIQSLDTFYNRVLYGCVMPQKPHKDQSDVPGAHHLMRLSGIGLLLIASFVLSVGLGWRCIIRPGPSGRDPAFSLTLLFVYLNVIYVTLVASCVEIGENNRFRFIIDPFILVGVGMWLNMILSRLAARHPVPTGTEVDE